MNKACTQKMAEAVAAKLRKLSKGVTAVKSPGPKELEACQALGRELAKAALH
jgi:hypothetical protein